jgi:hypothetical protein
MEKTLDADIPREMIDFAATIHPRRDQALRNVNRPASAHAAKPGQEGQSELKGRFDSLTSTLVVSTAKIG